MSIYDDGDDDNCIPTAKCSLVLVSSPPRGGGGVVLPYYSRRVWFLGRFGLKTGIDFDHYGLESGMVFKVTKRICLFNSR